MKDLTTCMLVSIAYGCFSPLYNGALNEGPSFRRIKLGIVISFSPLYNGALNEGVP